VTPPLVPAVEIGGSHVTAALVTPVSWRPCRAGTRLSLQPDGSARQILETIKAAARTLSGHAGSPCGVAIPGPFDYQAGTADYHGVGKFDALRGINMREELAPAFATEPAMIRFVNDADAFITGEWIAGQARGLARCIGITLGSGVGSGWLVDGTPTCTGLGVPPGGRAHHLTVDGVPLEHLVSSRAIRARYSQVTGEPGVDVKTIASRARRGETGARDVLWQAFTALGSALGPNLRAFAPDVIIIGGAMAASWDMLEPAFRDGAGPPALPHIRTSASTETSALSGAAYTACQDAAR
jgi:glucokinase